VVVAVVAVACAVAAAGTAEPNETEAVVIRMAHLFVQADVDDVRFDNIWVFEKPATEEPVTVDIVLPAQVELLGVDEPNEVRYVRSEGVIRRAIPGQSRVESVGFSYVVPNKAGRCYTELIVPYPARSIVVSVSGRQSRLDSNILRPDAFRKSRSRFSGLYTARDVAAGTKITISLSSLPCRDLRLVEWGCLLGLVLIFGAAGRTIHVCRRGAQSFEQDHAPGS